MWKKFISHLNSCCPVGKCKSWQKSQLKKDVNCQVAAAEAMGQEDMLTEAESEVAGKADDIDVDTDCWC